MTCREMNTRNGVCSSTVLLRRKNALRRLTRDIPQGYDKIQTIDVQVCFLTVQMLIGVITTCDSTPRPSTPTHLNDTPQ